MTLPYLTGVIFFADVVLVDQPVPPLHNGKLWHWDRRTEGQKEMRRPSFQMSGKLLNSLPLTGPMMSYSADK